MDTIETIAAFVIVFAVIALMIMAVGWWQWGWFSNKRSPTNNAPSDITTQDIPVIIDDIEVQTGDARMDDVDAGVDDNINYGVDAGVDDVGAGVDDNINYGVDAGIDDGIGSGVDIGVNDDIGSSSGPSSAPEDSGSLNVVDATEQPVTFDPEDSEMSGTQTEGPTLEPEPECDWNGWTRCIDGKMTGCVDGKIQGVRINCPYPSLCDPDDPTKCMAPEEECTEDGVPFCKDGSLYECVDGKKSLVEQCQYGCDLSKAECSPECSWTGELYDFETNKLRRCDAQGNITHVTECIYDYDVTTNTCKSKFMGHKLSFKNNGTPMYLVARRIIAGNGTVSLTANKAEASLFQKLERSGGLKFTTVLDPNEDPYVLAANLSNGNVELKYNRDWSSYTTLWQHGAGGILYGVPKAAPHPKALIVRGSAPITASHTVGFDSSVHFSSSLDHPDYCSYVNDPRDECPMADYFGIAMEEIWLTPKGVSVVKPVPPPPPPSPEEIEAILKSFASTYEPIPISSSVFKSSKNLFSGWP